MRPSVTASPAKQKDNDWKEDLAGEEEENLVQEKQKDKEKESAPGSPATTVYHLQQSMTGRWTRLKETVDSLEDQKWKLPRING